MGLTRLGPGIACLLLGAGTGCIIPFNGPGDIRRDIESITGSHYDRSLGLTVGRSGMALARWAVKRSNEGIPLAGIKKVEIGIYEAEPPHDSPQGPGLEASHWPEWTPMVEMHDDGEDVLILAEESGEEGGIKRMLLVIEGHRELVIIRLTGRLDRFIEEAFEYALREADRPDLLVPAVDQYREHSEHRAEP